MHFSTTTTTALLTFLAASVANAEELNASDVPTACSAICAPIVTLTSICDVDAVSGTSNQLLAQLASSDISDLGGEKRGLHKRGRLTSTSDLADAFDAKNSRKEKRGRLISSGALANAFEAKNGRKEKRGRLMSSGTLSSAFENRNGKLARMVKRQDDDDDGENDDTDGDRDEALEATCVCTNDSFDVAMIGGLCAGCLAGNGGVNEDMSTIMSQCGFTTSSYAETATALVANITVVATKPTGTATGSTTGAATGSATGTATGSTTRTATSTSSTTSASTTAGSGAAAMTRVAGWVLGVGMAMAWVL